MFFLPTRQKAGVDRFAKVEWKEKRHLERALGVLDRVGVKLRSTTFVDVGAHIGTTTITAVTRFGFESALAFEPELENFRLLRANLGVNGLEQNIRAFNVALSNEVGAGELVLRPTLGSKHRLLKDREAGRKTVSVSLTTLDALVDEGRLDPARVGLLWLDVEGHELEVLQGAGTLLERSVPIVMEFVPRMLRRNKRLAALHALLAVRYTHVVDLRLRPDHRLEPRSLDALDELAGRYAHGFTDLLVLHLPAVQPLPATRMAS